MGVHAGEIELEDSGELDGTAVRIASDVAGYAHRNEVLVSRTIHDLVAGSGVELQDCGVYPLSSIKQDWRLYRLVRDNYETEAIDD